MSQYFGTVETQTALQTLLSVLLRASVRSPRSASVSEVDDVFSCSVDSIIDCTENIDVLGSFLEMRTTSLIIVDAC